PHIIILGYLIYPRITLNSAGFIFLGFSSRIY
ncbi:MAG: hypothetical protein ACI9LV_000241, partial [Candidatus Nanohaloarchaea archaeon]